jgi:hypothetical protein
MLMDQQVLKQANGIKRRINRQYKYGHMLAIVFRSLI